MCYTMAASSDTGMMDELDDYCDDFLQFQFHFVEFWRYFEFMIVSKPDYDLIESKLTDQLKRMRTIDDKVIYELNNTIPTDYFAKNLNITDQCKDFYDQLHDSHEKRSSIISRCLSRVSSRVNKQKEDQQHDRDNIDKLKALRKEQTKLRLVQQEVNIEEVIKDRTIKAYYERCRNAYKPPIDRFPVV